MDIKPIFCTSPKACKRKNGSNSCCVKFGAEITIHIRDGRINTNTIFTVYQTVLTMHLSFIVHVSYPEWRGPRFKNILFSNLSHIVIFHPFMLKGNFHPDCCFLIFDVLFKEAVSSQNLSIIYKLLNTGKPV